MTVPNSTALFVGQGPLSTSGETKLSLKANVQGLGPKFKFKLSLKNTGATAVSDLPLTFCYDHKIYSVKTPLIMVQAFFLDAL